MRGYLAIVALMLVACGGEADNVAPPPPSPPVTPSAALQAVITNSRLLVGPMRVSIGVLAHNAPVKDATVHVRLGRTVAGQPQLKTEADAVFKNEGLEFVGIYVVNVIFDAPGKWLVEITSKLPSGVQQVDSYEEDVLATSPLKA